MSIIKSSNSTDELIVDPISKAARVTLYDKYGNEINSQKPNKFFLPILLDVTVVHAANSYIWAMRNGTTKTIKIDDILLNCGFRGTAAATSQVFELVRFSGANPTGGTPLAIGASVPRKNSASTVNSTIQDARTSPALALTVGGISFEPNGLTAFGVSRSVTSQQFAFDLSKFDLELGVGEGLAIRATAATVVGDTIQGHIHWTEE